MILQIFYKTIKTIHLTRLFVRSDRTREEDGRVGLIIEGGSLLGDKLMSVRQR